MSPKFAPIGMKTLSSPACTVASSNVPSPRFLYSFIVGALCGSPRYVRTVSSTLA